MLKCRDVLGLGSVYVDDALPTAELWQVRMHLLICSHCRAYVQKLRLTIHTVQELDALQTREADVELVLGRVLPRG
jgi:anti-sigma factor RsiW